MKKCVLAAALVVCLSLCCFLPSSVAYDDEQLRAADALYSLGLFLGTGSTYALDEPLTRAQGIVLVVRMLGMESEARNMVCAHPFSDVAEWASPYVGYAYANGITNGTGADTFGSEEPLTDWMFLTFCLRALNYSDRGDAPDFDHRDAESLARELKLVSGAEQDAVFSRGDSAEVFWNVLSARTKGEAVTMADRLLSQGTFTEAEWRHAQEIRENGKAPEEDSGEKTTIFKPAGQAAAPVPASEPTPAPGEDPQPTAEPATTPEPTGPNDLLPDFS